MLHTSHTHTHTALTLLLYYIDARFDLIVVITKTIFIFASLLCIFSSSSILSCTYSIHTHTHSLRVHASPFPPNLYLSAVSSSYSIRLKRKLTIVIRSALHIYTMCTRLHVAKLSGVKISFQLFYWYTAFRMLTIVCYVLIRHISFFHLLYDSVSHLCFWATVR